MRGAVALLGIVAALAAIPSSLAPAVAADAVHVAWKTQPDGRLARSVRMSAYPVDEELSRVASIFAGAAITVECPTLAQWAEDPLSATAWGYTHLSWTSVVIDPELCRAAHDLAAESDAAAYPLAADYYRAVAVHVLVHEALHLRRSWSARGHEDKVNCMAIRRFRRAADLLGADPDARDRIRPWALYEWWRLARLVPEYYLERCAVPGP